MVAGTMVYIVEARASNTNNIAIAIASILLIRLPISTDNPTSKNNRELLTRAMTSQVSFTV